jgi:hypothetical protein
MAHSNSTKINTTIHSTTKITKQYLLPTPKVVVVAVKLQDEAASTFTPHTKNKATQSTSRHQPNKKKPVTSINFNALLNKRTQIANWTFAVAY